MSMARGSGRQPFPVCSGNGWGQAEPGSGGAEGVGRREGKIKADGTPWVRSRGQALVCTLFGAAPLPGLHGAARRGKASICRVIHGTLAGNRRLWVDRRP